MNELKSANEQKPKIATSKYGFRYFTNADIVAKRLIEIYEEKTRAGSSQTPAR